MSTIVRNALGSAALVVVSVLATFFVFEGALRLFPGVLSENAQLRLHWAGQPSDDRNSPHSYIGHVPEPRGFSPDADATPATAEQIWAQRNHPPWPKSAAVIAVGDSLTYGQMVGVDQAWTTLLDDALPKDRVLTLGVIGAAPQQYLRVYETYGQSLSPKVVLVGLFLGNDIDDAVVFDDWRQKAPDQDYRLFRSGETAGGFGVWLTRLGRESYVVALAADLWRARRKDRFLQGETVDLASGERVQIVPEFAVGTARHEVPGDRGFDLVIQSLVSIDALAKKNNAACVVLLLPSKEEVYGQFASRLLPDLAAPAIAELQRRQIEHLDLGPAFRERAKDGRALYWEVDGHPNARGYALIAEHVIGYLRKNAARFGLSEVAAPAGTPGS